MTTEQVKAMTDEELRTKVAELLGWRRCDTEDKAYYRGKDEDGCCIEHSDDFDGDQLLPDYPHDLNACAEFEATLEGPDSFHYYAVLAQLCLDAGVPHCASAPAQQRCEAFVLTMTEENDEDI